MLKLFRPPSVIPPLVLWRLRSPDASRRDRPLCLSGGTTGDAVTITIDDRIVDSRFRGNDGIRGRGQAPTIAGEG